MRYTTFGPVSGCCGHNHGTPQKAQDCIDAERKKAPKGTTFDREIREVGSVKEIKDFDLSAGPGKPYHMNDGEVATTANLAINPGVEKTTFSVSKRFEMLSKITRMVIDGYHRAEFIAGSGGGGKTFTVLNEIANAGLEEVDLEGGIEDLEEGDEVQVRDDQFLVVSGATSPAELYRILFENSNALIVFDDCDSFLKDENAVNILKSVLDTTGDGTVSWNSKYIERMGIPTTFTFNGRVIFISNKKVEKVPQPLLSRSLILDMDMNNEDIMERAKMLSDKLMPELTESQREELLSFLEEHQNHLRDFSLRTFVLAAPMVAAGYEDWKDMVLFSA